MSSLLTRLNMGYRNNLRSVKVPVNNFNSSFLNALQRGGLISSYSVDFKNPHFYNVTPQLTIDARNAFLFKRISSGGKRRYVKTDFIRNNQSPFFVLLTSKGVLTSCDSLEELPHTGGECFCILEFKK